MDTELIPSERLAEFVRAMRGERGLRDLSAEMNGVLSPSTLFRFENGKPATSEQLDFLCQHFGVTKEHILNFPLLVRYPERCTHANTLLIDSLDGEDEEAVPVIRGEDLVLEDRTFAYDVPISVCLDCGKLGYFDGWSGMNTLEGSGWERPWHKEAGRKAFEAYQRQRGEVQP